MHKHSINQEPSQIIMEECKQYQVNVELNVFDGPIHYFEWDFEV